MPSRRAASWSPLSGQHNEHDAVLALFWREEVFLVTLTGPGGVGKARPVVSGAHAFPVPSLTVEAVRPFPMVRVF